MALNLPNWNFGTPPNPLQGLADHFIKGLEARQGQERFNREYEKSGYENMIKAAEAMYAPQLNEGNAQNALAQAFLTQEQGRLANPLAQAQIRSYEADALANSAKAQGYNISNEEAQLFLDYLKPRLSGNLSAPQAFYEGVGENAFNGNYGLPQQSSGIDFSDPFTRSLLEKRGIKLPEEEIDRRKEINKLDFKMAENAQTALVSGYEILDQLNALENLINEAPGDFRTATGPIGSSITKYLGKEAAQQMLGAINTYSGNITLAAASSLKGAFTGRDQALLQEVKPNAKDTPAVFLGKLQAMKANTHLVNQRNELISQYIRNGVDSGTAIKLAREQTPIKSYKDFKSEKLHSISDEELNAIAGGI